MLMYHVILVLNVIIIMDSKSHSEVYISDSLTGWA